MRVVELSIAGLLALAGFRSIWNWSRRAFEGTDLVDHVLYALFVTGRAGLWFSLAGFFVIYASVDARGRAAIDELEPFRWYLVVPLVLAGLQLAAGWFLGRREPVSRRP